VHTYLLCYDVAPIRMHIVATYGLWAVGIGLEALVLFRAGKSGILGTYPMFCVYLTCILVSDVALLPMYRLFGSAIYTRFYWTKEFVCMLAGYAVVLELIDRGLECYGGPKKLARKAGFGVFAGIVSFTGGEWLVQRRVGLLLTSIEVQRDLRAAELVLLGLVIGLLLYYHIPVGRNLKGIVLGYGLCVATVVMADAFRSYKGQSFQTAFSLLRSYSFFASLLIWTVFLWSYEPNPVPDGPAQLSDDYDALANWTKGALAGLRGQLGKAARP
jgi:hypothetical protein